MKQLHWKGFEVKRTVNHHIFIPLPQYAMQLPQYRGSAASWPRPHFTEKALGLGIKMPLFHHARQYETELEEYLPTYRSFQIKSVTIYKHANDSGTTFIT